MTARFMQPVEINLFRANSGSDTRQVPASGASIFVAYKGATVLQAVTVYDWAEADVVVESTERIQSGDVLQLGETSASTMTVSAVSADGTVVTCVADNPTPIVLVVGARLLIANRGPQLYGDSAGSFPITGSIVTVSALGYCRFYTNEPAVDYVATGGGLPNALLFRDIQAGWVETSKLVFNVLDYATFQAAHDALPASGGTIFVPAGTYSSGTTPAFTGMIVTKPMALIGEANGPFDAISILVPDLAPNPQNRTAISVSTKGGCLIKNLMIEWPSSITAGTGRGIRWYKPGATAQMADFAIDNVTIHRSPNLSFEFVCDGYTDSYVSKLSMVGCTAFEAKSGGSLFLGGAGSNNNFFERCEFNGGGFGWFNNVVSCSVSSTGTTVTAAGGDSNFSTIQAGDEVAGMGIAVGTTVFSVNTGVTPHTMVLSQNGIANTVTTLTFYRPTGSDPTASGHVWLPRGHVHLLRTSISRFDHCSFQGPGTSPALTTDLVSNDLVLRDAYREKDTNGSGQVHSFIVNNMWNLLIDGLFHLFHSDNSLLLKTGPGGLKMGRIANAQLVTNQATPASPNVIVLSNDSDELVVDHSMELSTDDGKMRDLVVAPPSSLPTIAPVSGVLTLPNGSDEVFRVSGTDPVTSIVALRPKRRVTLAFTGTAPMMEGGNLKLSGNFLGGADRAISLVCEGATSTWLETSRNGASAWLNSSDFATIQAAIDSLPAGGGTVFIPAGIHTLTTTLYTPCDRPCHLIGEGASLGHEQGTVLRWTTNVGMLRLRGSGSSVRRITLENTSGGDASAENSGYGIAVGRRAVTDPHPPPGVSPDTEYALGHSVPCAPMLIEDVDIKGSPGWGLYIPGFGLQSDGQTAEPDKVDNGTLSFWVDCKRVRIRGSRKYGTCFTGGGCTALYFEDCAFLWVGSGQVPNANYERYYVYVSESPGVAFVRCTFEGYSPANKEWVTLWKAQSAVFDSCWFEEDPRNPVASYTPTPFIFLTGNLQQSVVHGCQDGAIRNCHFVRGDGGGGQLKFIKVAANGGARGLTIVGPDGVSNNAVRNDDASKSYKDTAHIDLGGNGNDDITVLSTGFVYDQSAGLKLPIQYSGIPRTSNVVGRLLNKLPGVFNTELASPSDSRILATQNGNLVLNWDLLGDNSQIGALMSFWGGAHPGWRLANNLPTMTTSQRNGISTWVQGDMIYNSTTDKLEILVGTTWRTVTLT